MSKDYPTKSVFIVKPVKRSDFALLSFLSISLSIFITTPVFSVDYGDGSKALIENFSTLPKTIESITHTFYAILFIQALVCAGLSAWVGSEKGRSALVSFFLGLIFGILGLIAIAGLPSINHISQSKVGRGHNLGEKKFWQCPKCNHTNPNDTYSCQKCNYSLV